MHGPAHAQRYSVNGDSTRIDYAPIVMSSLRGQPYSTNRSAARVDVIRHLMLDSAG